MILRRVAYAAAFMLLVIPPNIRADVLMGRYDPSQSSCTSEKLQFPLALDWDYVAGKFDNNPAASVVAGKTCYFASGDLVYAVDLDTGALKWKYPSDPARLTGTVKATPVLDGGNLYFGTTDSNLYCIDAATGLFKWFFPVRGAIRCSPVVQDGMLYFGTDDNSLYAIVGSTGDAAWPKPFTVRDDFAVGIAVSSGMIIASSMDGNVYGVNAASGKLRTQPFRLTEAPTRTSPVIASNLAVIAVGNSLYGLSIRGNQLRWRVTLPSEAVATPAVQDSDIYVPCRDKKIYAYNISGRQPVLKWVAPANLDAIPMSSPTVAGDTLYVTGSRGVVAAFSTTDGTLKWRYVILSSSVNTPGQPYTDASSSPIVANGVLLVLTDDGVMHCFNPKAPDSEAPRAFYMTPANGTVMSGAPPIKISCSLYDIGSGVDFNSVSLSLDNQPVEDVKTDPAAMTVTYVTSFGEEGKPAKMLEDGAHTITVTARDYKGNLLKQEWCFVADSSMPAPKRSLPAVQEKKTKEPSRDKHSSDREKPEKQKKEGDSSVPPPPPPPMQPDPAPGGGRF